MDLKQLFAEATVATAPSPATSGTSMIVSADFPLGGIAAPFDVIVAPPGVRAISSNAECCRVTGKVGTTWTITRATQGSTARSILVGDKVYLAITPKTFTDIETSFFATAFRTAAQTIPTAAFTNVSMNAADTTGDPYGWHDPAGANPERITVPFAGIYMVTSHIQWIGGTTNTRRGQSHNWTGAGNVVGGYTLTSIAGTAVQHTNAVGMWYGVAAGDAIWVQAYQDTGGNLDIAAADLGVVYLGT